MSVTELMAKRVRAWKLTFLTAGSTILSLMANLAEAVAQLTYALAALALIAFVFSVIVCRIKLARGRVVDVWLDVALGAGILFLVASFLSFGQFVANKFSDQNQPVVTVIAPELQRIAIASEDIARNTLETAQNTREMANNTERIADTSEDINAGIQELKKEVSEDPRKELANLGISWNGDNFLDAVRSGDFQTLELFLAGGFNPVTARDSDGNMLPDYIAGLNQGIDETFELLQNYGLAFDSTFSVNGSEANEKTLIGRAAEAGNTPVIKALVEHGADPNALHAVYASYFYWKIPPLSAAIRRKEWDAANALLDVGADPSQEDWQAMTLALETFTVMDSISTAVTDPGVQKLLPRLAPTRRKADITDVYLALVKNRQSSTARYEAEGSAYVRSAAYQQAQSEGFALLKRLRDLTRESR